MHPATPIAALEPQIRAAFQESYQAVFSTRTQWFVGESEPRELLLGFAARYRQLTALPRRARRSLARRWKHTLGAIALLMTLGQAPAWAATIAVAPGTPPAIKADGRCSLIEAMVNANRNARPHLDCVAGSGTVDRIVLPASSQQVLDSQEMLPQVTSAIVIEGNGSTVRRNTRTDLTFFSVAAGGNLTLNKTIVTGSGSFTGGHGVTNAGRITVDDSAFSDLSRGLSNSGGIAVVRGSSFTGNWGYYNGGGVANSDGGTVTITDSVISGNGGYFGGGGLHNGIGSRMTVTDSVVSGNRITYEGAGGGIENRGTLVLVGTTVSGNNSQAGGGIANASTGTATIRRSTISGNWIDAQYLYQPGGGIANNGKLIIANSTVSGNEAPGYGGGIFSGGLGSVTLESSTVTGNTLYAPAPYLQKGGGIHVYSGTLTLQRSIVSGNVANTGREINVNAGVAVKANDFNLFGRGGDAGIVGFTPGSTDIVPNAPIGGILRPLADNGGPTRTHALAMGSPALNASPDDAKCFAVDQRGNPRPRGPACDIGSFEGSAVLCGGRVTTQVGTDGPDELTGTPGADVIAGLNGNDVIGGLDGNDLICGGGGADRLFGGAGNDTLLGQGGNDQLFGNGGNDSMNGGPGQDQCDGGIHSGAGDTATACEAVTGVP